MAKKSAEASIGRSIDGVFWSNESIREKTPEELYPQTETETDEEYATKLGHIAQLMAEDDGPRHTEKSGKAIKVDDESIRKRISSTIGSTLFRHTLPTELAEKTAPNYEQLERQEIREEKAEKYMKTLDGLSPSPSDFIGMPGYSSRKIENDQRQQDAKTGGINLLELRKSEDERDADRRISVLERAFESVMYPLTVNYGLFDDKDGRRARPIYPSRYDDLMHGIDCAFEIPFTTRGKDGDKHGFQPIAFDCTTAITQNVAKDKLSHGRRNGTSDIEYARNEDKDLTSFSNVPTFVIALDKADISNLLDDKNIESIPDKTKYLLYKEIAMQADLRMKTIVKERTKPRAKDERLAREHFNTEEDFEAYRSMLRIGRAVTALIPEDYVFKIKPNTAPYALFSAIKSKNAELSDRKPVAEPLRETA